MTSPRFASWIEDTLKVTDIELDQVNPRIPAREATQREIIRELIDEHKVFDLARSIAEKGYFPTERIIVIQGDNLPHKVVEGNRRVAALKLLVNPEAGPDDQQKRFQNLRKSLSRSDLQGLSQLPAVIAPSRADANPVIADRHTGLPIERWSTIMQARFYQGLLRQGYSYGHILEEYGLNKSSLSRFIRTADMYDIALAVDLSADAKKVVYNEQNFPITTLERLYSNNNVRDFLGISFDDRGRVKGHVSKSEFATAYAKIIEDICSKRIDSRVANDASSVNSYLNEISTYKPNPENRGSFDASNFGGLSSAARSTPIYRKGRTATRTPQGLIPQKVKCYSGDPKVKQLYDELRRIPVARYPNATAVLFRTFLECVLLTIFKNSGEFKQIRKKDGKPTLSNMLNRLASDDCKLLDDPSLKQICGKATKHPEHITSLDTLNMFVHNEEYYTSQEAVRANWRYFEPVLEKLLTSEFV